jgi:two-component system, NtrC family, nitrogen regulation sensor histidine kinase GlnL
MQLPSYLLDHQTTSVVVLDDDLAVLYLNQAAEALLEVSGTRVRGEPIERIFSDPSTPETALQEVIVKGQPFTKRHARVRMSSGVFMTVDYTVSPIIDRGPERLLLEIQPLDRILRINRDDQHASVQETTRKLVRGLAHEIKNPLGGIRGAAQLLERELATEHLRDYTRIIIEEADRLRNLVDRMLGPSQLPRPEPVNVHRVLERVVHVVDAEEPGKIHFERDYDPSLPDIDADLEQMIQAMLNIVRNARQALDDTPHPTIKLTTRIIRQFTIGATRHRMVVRVDIRDNGPGIPPDLFERMYYPMISGRADGSGLGLSITQSIVGQHGGIIECESRPGETVFTVYLPLEQTHGAK